MTNYTDIMVDIETTGLRPDRNAILQIAAVKFNYDTGDVSDNFFDKSLRIPVTRFWDEDTRKWWSKMPEVYAKITARQEEPHLVLQALNDWVDYNNGPSNGYRFWGKPTHFDFTFIQSYYDDFGIYMPFHYRSARDMNSFMSGLAGDPTTQETQVDNVGDAHNAIHDTLYQIKYLFAIKEKFQCKSTD